jgi:hypothetical protein
MRESANFCENRWLSSLSAVNAALGTSLSNPPMFDARSKKTGRLYSEAAKGKVKTK